MAIGAIVDDITLHTPAIRSTKYESIAYIELLLIVVSPTRELRLS